MTKGLINSPRANLSPAEVKRRQHTRHPEIYDDEEKAAARREDMRKQNLKDYAETFNNEAGIRVLRDLCALCGFTSTSVCGSVTDRTLDPIGTIHNEAMRKVYLHIRQYLPKSVKTQVED